MYEYHPHLMQMVVDDRRRELLRISGNSRLRREVRRDRRHRRKQ
jgi:hypothetical protein